MKPHLSQRLSILLLLLALLGAQWGWLAHEHQAHDSSQVCEMCVTGASLGHGISPSASPFTLPASSASDLPASSAVTLLPPSYRHTLGQRGPPTLS